MRRAGPWWVRRRPNFAKPSMRLLLIEDNLRLAELTTSGLRAAGFTVDACHTAADADAALNVVAYDAAIIDLGLPDMDGIELLKHIRAQRRNIPVVILTARDGLKDRVKGLDAGADDYLLKPFAMEELVARLHAVLRRPADVLPDRLQFQNLGLDPSRHQVTVDGSAVPLTRREFDVLEIMIRNVGRVVSKTMIDEKLHGFGDDVSANSVEAIMSRLRKRLRATGATLNIVTIRGVGYMIGGPVR